MESVGALTETVGGISESIKELKGSVGELTESVGFIIGFIQEQLVTKSEHYDLKQEVKLCATKQELHEFKDEILTAIDNSTKSFVRLDHEQVALRGNSGRLEERVEKIEQHLGLAA